MTFRRVKSFLRSEDGPTTTEYAVMLAVIVGAAMAAIGGLGNRVSNIFSGLEGDLGAQTGF